MTKQFKPLEYPKASNIGGVIRNHRFIKWEHRPLNLKLNKIKRTFK